MKSKKCKVSVIAVAAVIAIAAIICSGCSGGGKASSSASPSAKAQTTDYAKYAGTYTIYRTDYRVGVTGDIVGSDPATAGLKADDYIIMGDDGSFNMTIAGVGFNSNYTISGSDKVHYSGQSGYSAQRMKFDGKKEATQGTLTIEGYIVDDCPYMVLSTSDGVNGKFTTFYCYYTKQ